MFASKSKERSFVTSFVVSRKGFNYLCVERARARAGPEMDNRQLVDAQNHGAAPAAALAAAALAAAALAAAAIAAAIAAPLVETGSGTGAR